MVLKGQFLERPTLIPLPNGLVLEGLSHRGELRPGVLVLPPPPLEGSGMDHVVGAELAYAVSHRGYPTLRFNYRGVGGSQGEPSRLPDAWLEDAVEALKLAMENTQQPVVLAALGASDAVALRLAERAEVAGVVLINPSIVQPADFVNRGPAPWPLMVVVAEHDATVDRPLWSAVLQGLGAHFAVIPEATRTYQRNLPLVGKAVVSLVEKALSCDGQDTIVS